MLFHRFVPVLSIRLCAALSLIAPISAAGESIAIVDPSFDKPLVTPDPNRTDQSNFVLPFITDWHEEGAPSSFGTEPPNLNDTGVFFNPLADRSKPEEFQRAYLRFNQDAGKNGKPFTSISQQTAATYDKSKDYTFSIDVGRSLNVTAAPGVNSPLTIRLWLGYWVGDKEFISVLGDGGERVLDAFVEIPQDGTLDRFNVSVLGDDLPGAALGKQIVVRVSQEGGLSGAFEVDNAALDAVPEPGTAIMLLIASGFLARRRCG